MIYILENEYGINIFASNSVPIGYMNTSRPIGYANTSRIHDNVFYFNRLFVQPEFRNKGYATEILKTLLEKFKEKHYVLYLDINPYGDLNYEELETFYMKHGFKKYKVYNKIIGNFYTAYYFNREEMENEGNKY